MKGFNGGMAQLMKQANQMQLKMKKTQEEIGKHEFTGTSGGSACTVVVTGDSKMVSVKWIKSITINDKKSIYSDGYDGVFFV